MVIVRKALLLACVAATPHLVAVPEANAAVPSWDYEGGCGMAVVSDGTETAQTGWDGVIWVIAAATDGSNTPAPTAGIHAACELRINGAAPGTVVIEDSGTGAAAGAAQLSFNAHPDDRITTCDVVMVNESPSKACTALRRFSVVPDAVANVARNLSGSACDEVGSLAWTPLDQPPVLDIEPDGNVYAFGQPVWRCSPSASLQHYWYADTDPPLAASIL